MIRTNNYITVLLIIIVAMLLVGVFIAIYYVLELDWFEKKPVKIYNELQVYQETVDSQTRTQKEIKYDITKRTYNLSLDTDDLKVIVYKDGTVGITLADNEENNQLAIYKEILNKEIKLDVTNIVRAYDVIVSKNSNENTYILLLDVNGNLYSLDKQQLAKAGEYKFVKIDGLAKIIDVRQITNDDLTENTTGINVIAIDQESNELLLTDYLLK